MVVDAPVVGGQRHIAIPDGCLLKMAGALLQRGTAGPLVDLHAQVDGRDLQGPQVSAAVIEVVCHLRKAGRCGRSAVTGELCARRDHGRAAAVDDRAGNRRTAGGQIWRQIGPGPSGIRTGRTEAGRDHCGVLADILVLACPAVRRMHHLNGGGLSVLQVTRCVNGMIQRAGGQRKGREQAQGQNGHHRLSH